MPATRTPSPWRAARAQRLRRMAERGLSMAQAAGRLGVTRNTVVGTARDYGIRFQGAPVFTGPRGRDA